MGPALVQWNLSYTDPMGPALVQWNLSYTDPMGPALVYTVEPQLPYGTSTSTVEHLLYRCQSIKWKDAEKL